MKSPAHVAVLFCAAFDLDGHNMLPTWKAADLLKRDKLEIFPQDRCSAVLLSPH
jgi:hypothetical protein